MSNTNAETIRDFLISLGFELDDAGQKKFSAVVAGVTANVLKLGAVVESAAASVVGFAVVAANGLDKLYWQAQRTGGAAEQIKSLGYAVSQAGGTVEGLNSSLENVAKFLRNNPGGEGFLRNMGIQTRDANGNLRDTASLVALVGERLSALPTYRANQYASILGIDENTLMAMRRGVGAYTADYQKIMRTMGYNPTAATKHANTFMTELYKLKTVMGTAKDKIGGELARTLTPSIEKFTNLILKHWPTIEKFILSVVDAILAMSEILGQMVFRGAKGIQDLIGWWKQLDEGSKGLIKTFGLVAAAWSALNTKFLASPIGIITALMAALFLLYDDYMTWKEGGKSLIDWGQWEGTLEKVGENIKQLKDGMLDIKDALGGWENVFWGFAIFFAGKWLTSVLGTLGKLSKEVSKGGLTKLLRRAGWLAYGGYLVSDWDNIAASAQASWNSNKRDLQRLAGNAGQALGIENKWASQNNGYHLNETTVDIPTGDPFVSELQRKIQRHELTFDEANKILDEKYSPNNAKGNTRGERNNNPLNMEFAKQRGATVENHPEQRFAQFATAYEGLERTAWQLRRYFNGLTDNVNRQSVETIIEKWAPPGGKDKNRTEDYINRVAQRLGVRRDDRLDLNNHDVMYALMNAMSVEEIGKPLPYDKRLVMAAITGDQDPTKEPVKTPKTPATNSSFDPRVLDNAMANIGNMVSGIDSRVVNNAQANVDSMMSRRVGDYTPELLRAGAGGANTQTTIAPNYNITVNGVESPREAAALTSESVQRTNAILVRSLQTKVG
ncbi:lytic transglycosylase catalytic [Xenorhabdus sp. IM139775]|uniref:lytic transglycosylase catalytic n=1 Tax=Xenorhabdus sp. IM139775 TaxID=3025876 RepID=UPI002358CF84|nr:lytic transglycosylase catalytic [Xenorhabdus sp. IM139775]MDC9593504.1 lytic transglycosylase catalytic [Xenorhabdus sp. IM139775]